MNWKTDLRLSDLEPSHEIEVTCRRCGVVRYERVSMLMRDGDLAQRHLDEIEMTLHCPQRGCRGGVRIALVYDDRTEGFVGGMA